MYQLVDSQYIFVPLFGVIPVTINLLLDAVILSRLAIRCSAHLVSPSGTTQRLYVSVVDALELHRHIQDIVELSFGASYNSVIVVAANLLCFSILGIMITLTRINLACS